MRRFFKVTLVSALLALGAAATAQDKVRIQTDWIPSGEHAMYYGGWRKGIFAAEGIDVTITRGYGSGDTVTKLAGGAFDFGVADVSAVMTARACQIASKRAPLSRPTMTPFGRADLG